MFVIVTDQPIPFYWTGTAWAHSLSVAVRFDTPEQAEVERWNHAGTESVVARVEP